VRNTSGGGGGGFNEYRINIMRIAAAVDDKCKIDVNQAQKPEPVHVAYDLRMYNVHTIHYFHYYTITQHNMYIATIIILLLSVHRIKTRRIYIELLLQAMYPKMRKIKLAMFTRKFIGIIHRCYNMLIMAMARSRPCCRHTMICCR